MFPKVTSHVIRISAFCAVFAFSSFMHAQQTESVPPEPETQQAQAPAPPQVDSAATTAASSDEAAPANGGAATTLAVTPPSGTTVAILADTSHTDRQALLRSTVERFMRALPEGETACLFSASGAPVLVQECTDRRDDLTKAARRLKTGGRPALFAGIQTAAEHLRGQRSDRLAIVLITPARKVNEPGLEDTVATLRSGKNVELNAIAGPGSDWQLQEQLQRLAVKTGGFAIFPSKPGDLSRVAEVAARRMSSGEDAALSARTSGDKPGHQKYTTLIVRSVAVADNPDTREFQSGDDELMQKMLIGRLQHEKAFAYVVDGRNDNAQVQTAQGGGRALELVTSIVQYRRGNRTQRRLIGYVGGAMVKVNVLLRDAVSGRPVQAFMAKGASSSGLFAGSNDEVQSKAIKEVVNTIASDVKKFGRPD